MWGPYMFAEPLDWKKPLGDERLVPKSLFGYDVLEYIGQGAGSNLYAVTQPLTHQIYALKHVVRTNEKSERFIEQLQTEYDVGRSVNHPSLRRSIDLKINRTMLRKTIDAALVLELFDGEPLEFSPPETIDEAVECFIQVGHALAALHANGWVHCDLKPNNLLRSSNGTMKVIDLGQACRTGTIKERIQGTPDYISPEQVKCEAVSPRTDVFNFGATLYWVLCGKNIPTLFNISRSENSFLVDAKITSPQDHNRQVPENLSNLVMECVRTSPGKRPDSMAVVARRLEVIQHMMRHRPNSDSSLESSLDDSFGDRTV
jgi:eukaryotic-like serine/threonine-protein kinase